MRRRVNQTVLNLRTLSRALAVAALVALVGGCGGGAAASVTPQPTAQALWPAPADPMERAVAAGIEPGPKEYMTNHVHAHLDVFVDGKPIQVPAGIGINIKDPDVRTFNDPEGTAYGGIELCDAPCISPLHTHDSTGIIHTESDSADERHTLGQFFTEWGVPLTATCAADLCDKPLTVYVNGREWTDDPRDIPITDKREIAVVIGTPPATIPSTADFSKA